MSADVQQFTVVGIYADNDQRWATCVEADTPQEAERLARWEADGELLIAGVIEGDHPVIDGAYANDEGAARERF